MRELLAIAAALLLATGCANETAEQASSPAKDAEPTAGSAPEAVAELPLPEGSTRIGEALTVAEAVPLATVKASPADYFEKTILVEATASAVCQARGCWLTISDGDGEPIWVRWSSGCGGKYAFPKDLAGQKVLVQGSFYEKEIAPADAEHLAGESEGLKAEEIAGKTYEMNATACVILPETGEPSAAG